MYHRLGEDLGREVLLFASLAFISCNLALKHLNRRKWSGTASFCFLEAHARREEAVSVEARVPKGNL
jgi:hypothetical protein